MAVKIELVKEFSTTHEREFWIEFSKLFQKEFSSKDDNHILLGNITCDGKELDALIIKKDAIMWGKTFKFSSDLDSYKSRYSE